MVFSRLNERQLDALREICNVGMGHAATALSQLTGKAIHLEVPRVMLTDTAGIAEFIGASDSMVVGIHLRMLGTAQGNILMTFPRDNAARILEQLLPTRVSGGDSLTELELSALKEVGNILASAYLNALGEMLRMTLIPSVPLLEIGHVSAVVAQTLSEAGAAGGMALILDTEFFSKDERVNGQFMLLPSSSSLEIILAALGDDLL